jgi:hypothetical protein
MVKCFVWQLAAFVGYRRKIPHVIVMRVLVFVLSVLFVAFVMCVVMSLLVYKVFNMRCLLLILIYAKTFLMSKIFGSPLFLSPAILFAFAGVRSVGGVVQIEAAVDGDAEVGADIRVVRSVVQEERSDEEGFWFRTSY